MKLFLEILKISRPRFWLYLAGTFVVGTAFGGSGTEVFLTPQFLYGLFYFLIPANIFLYGVNDYYDSDTDVLNSKKSNQESRLVKKNKTIYSISIFVSALLSIPLFIMLSDIPRIFLLLFLILSFFYSASPIRLKARPILDFSSNILYVLPGFLAFTYFSGELPRLFVWVSAFFWTAAMHVFSAIPDILPDKKAGVSTTATLLGKKNSLIVCTVFWMITAVIITYVEPLFMAAFIYPFIPVYLLIYSDIKVDKVYWKFPAINGVVGFFLFWHAMFKNII